MHSSAKRPSEIPVGRHLRTVILSLLVLLFIATGCGDTVTEIDFPETEPRLTVSSYFNPDSTWRVRVSESISQNEDRVAGQQGVPPLPPVGNATVQLLRDGRVVDTLSNIETDSPIYTDYDGLYGLPQTPRPEAEYELRVRAPGFDAVTARNAIPDPVPVTRASFTDSVYTFARTSQDIRQVGQFQFVFRDPPGESNYYRIAVYRLQYSFLRSNSALTPLFNINADLNRDVFANPETFASGDWVEEFPFRRSVVFTDQSFDGQEFTLTVPIIPSRSFEKGYEAVLTTITEEYYDYQHSIRLQEATTKNPFAEPVAIQSNMQGGFGIFAAERTMAVQRAVLNCDVRPFCSDR